jgi:hypothetical protein
MTDWQVTAATIFCDAVADEVTVLVYRDFSVGCTGYQQYYQPSRETLKSLEKRGKKLTRPLKCEGLECYRVASYREKLRAEEAGENRKVD